MFRFLRTWLVPILAALMIIGIAISFVPLTKQSQARAESELSLVMDRAFARIGVSEHQAEPVIAAEEKNLLDKANAVARFLEHDDALLASDALRALCEQLSIDRIDVSNIDGVLIASSEESRINLSIGTQEAFTWTMAAANDAKAALTQADKTNASTLYACVGREDIEGFVLLTREDPYAADALQKSGVEAQLADLVYGGDVLFLAQTSGADGFFNESGNRCLRKTVDNVTLIAARPLEEVYAVRNGAFLAFGTALICIAICGIAAYLLRLEPVTTVDEDDTSIHSEGEPSDTFLLNETEGEAQRKRRSKRRNSEEADAESDDEIAPEPDEELQERRELIQEGMPRQAGRMIRRNNRSRDGEDNDSNGEDPFEKIVE